MTPGTPVEVQIVWAGGSAPLKTWADGYRFVHEEPNPVTGAPNAIVEVTQGPFLGARVRFSTADVRNALDAPQEGWRRQRRCPDCGPCPECGRMVHAGKAHMHEATCSKR